MLRGVKFQTKIPSHSSVLVQENNRNTASFEDKRQGYKMSMVLDTRKSNFGSQRWLWLYTWFIMTLHYRMRQILVQNAKAISLQKMSLHNVSGFSLQNASLITKCVCTVYIAFF